MPDKNLFELGQEYLQLAELIRNEADELNDELDAWLANNALATEQKIEAYCSLIENYYQLASTRHEEATRINNLAVSAEETANNLKKRLRDYLLTTGQKRIQTTRHEVSLRKPGGKRALLINGPVPEEFTVTKTEIVPDKDKIRATIESGETLGFAELKQGENVLVIK